MNDMRKLMEATAPLFENFESEEVLEIINTYGGVDTLVQYIENGEFYDSDMHNELYAYYADSGDMPYGVVTGDEGTSDDWILDRIENMDILPEPELGEEVETRLGENEDLDERAYELEDIAGQMLDLLEQALALTKGTDEYDRAKSYWYPHILMAITDDHGYLGGSMSTMLGTARDLLGGRMQ